MGIKNYIDRKGFWSEKTTNNSPTLNITGFVVSNQGISGSLTSLADGSPYLISSGTIVITTNSNGQIEFSGSFAPSLLVLTEPAATRTPSESDDGALIRCTNVSGCVVTYTTGALSIGHTTQYVQYGASGSVIVTGSNGLNVRIPSTFNTASYERYSSMFVTVTTNDEILISGDLGLV